MLKKFKLTKVGNDNYQIQGEVNGVAIKMRNGSYQLKISFFTPRGQVTIETNPENITIKNERDIRDKVNRIVNREFEEILFEDYGLEC